MKVKKIFIQIIAMLMCVITLSFSIGGKFCFYNNIGRAHAAGTVTITLGSLALEEIIFSIAIAVLGAEVAYQYRDEIIDAYKEYSENGSTLYTRNNLMEVYYNGEYYSLTWDDYTEMLKGMGSTAPESFDDYKEKFNNTYVKPAKEYLQYVAEFYTDLFTGSPAVGDSTYIDGLAEYLKQEYFDSSIIDKMVSGESYQLKFSTAMNKVFTCKIHNAQCHITHFADCEVSGFYAAYFTTSGANASCTLEIRGIIDGKNKKFTNYTGLTSCGDVVTWSAIEYDSMCTNLPLFSSYSELLNFLQTGEGWENAINKKIALDTIAVTGDDIPTVGNWEELWERLKNPDLPWWFLNPDALPGTNAVDLPWFDVAGLHDWANDIPSIKDGIIDTNPDIPWTDVWDKVIDIPDVVIPALDFPYVDVDDPTKPTPTAEPTTKPTAEPLPTTKPGEVDSAQPVVDLSKFFPFCIPFDLIHLIQALDAEPVAPKWTLKLEPPQFPVEWEVVIDLADFESLAKIFRTGETLLFVVGLILITRGIIKG